MLEEEEDEDKEVELHQGDKREVVEIRQQDFKSMIKISPLYEWWKVKSTYEREKKERKKMNINNS